MFTLGTSFMSGLMAGSAKANMQPVMFAGGNPFRSFANTLNGWMGPAKALLLSAAGLFFVIWAIAHSTGGEDMKRKGKSGWMAATVGTLIGYGAVSIIQYLSQQGSNI